MTCIEEMHQQLGGTVVAKLEALNVKPAQLKQLQARLQQVAISGETVQDFPLFQAVTAEPNGRRPGSATSRSDSSTQVRLDLPTKGRLNKRVGNPNRFLRRGGNRHMTEKKPDVYTGFSCGVFLAEISSDEILTAIKSTAA